MIAAPLMRRAPAPRRLQSGIEASRSFAARLAGLAALASGVTSVARAASVSAGFTVTVVLNGGAPIPPPAPPPVIAAPGSSPSFPGAPPAAGGELPPTELPATDPPVAQAPGPAPAPAPGGGGAIPVLVPPVIEAPSPAPVLASSGICTSASQSQATNAQVQVVCSTGQFVSIEPSPGRPFGGTHGGAFRFTFGPGEEPAPALSTLAALGTMGNNAATLTAVRMINLDDSGGPLEMLVSF